ncbi:hypothetical protein EJ07DRAFT_166242 [Lizonia empirigonia]|nr:hypothetical protein EJ07DRAFT_166242 [Lizonia empirigonia]
MSISEQNPITQYTTLPNNYIGSAFFLSYIVAALCLTSTISYSLYTQYTSLFHSHPSSPPSKFRQNSAGEVETRSARARHVKIYTALALMSFTSISWHMLGFLVTSFLDWDKSSTRNASAVLGWNIWKAGKGTFTDSDHVLIKHHTAAYKTSGQQFGFTARTMVPFIILGQNLPISFAVSLFIIQLHLAAPDVSNNKEQIQKHAPPKQKPIASLVLPTPLLNAAILAQPGLRAHPGFSYLVLAERLLLVLPHTGLLKLNDADNKKSAAISGGFDVDVRDVLTALLYKGQAVKTMGWDAVLSVVVYGVLSWGADV